MAKATDITIEVNTKLSVDRKTADMALRLVELYMNANGVDVIGERKENGETELHYEPAR